MIDHTGYPERRKLKQFDNARTQMLPGVTDRSRQTGRLSIRPLLTRNETAAK